MNLKIAHVSDLSGMYFNIPDYQRGYRWETKQVQELLNDLLRTLLSPHNMEENKIIIYQTEGGQTQIDVRLENETVWLTQAQMAELFETTKQNVNLHFNVVI